VVILLLGAVLTVLVFLSLLGSGSQDASRHRR
jgi:hypothetical protein